MFKRGLKEEVQSGASKKSRLLDEGPKFHVSSQEELDINILRFQNRKLSERLRIRNEIESDLKARIEQLEKKQTSTEAIVFVVNRYWNQFNEDLRILLQRFDAQVSVDSEEERTAQREESTASFLSRLSNQDELEESLQQRVDVSIRAVAKILHAFDRIVHRNDKITGIFNGEGNDADNGEKLNNTLKQVNIELLTDNKKLNTLVTSLQEQQHNLNLKYSELKDKVDVLENVNEDMKGRIDDLEINLKQTRSKELRLQEQLQEARDRLRDADFGSGNSDSNGRSGKDNLSQIRMEDIQKELEELRELANNRMIELDSLNGQHKEALRTVKKLEMDLQCLPENVIYETVEYKCLQSHFSVLYNESMQLKTQLDETRSMIATAKTAHLRQIEHMESEELSMQKRLRTEVIQLEDQLAQVRKEYEMLRLEFEQNLAANEQTGPINREMRNLITSLQNHNQQLKGEIQRYKRRLKEANGEVFKMKEELEQTQHQLTQHTSNSKNEVKVEIKSEPQSADESSQSRQRSDSETSGKEMNKEEIKTEDSCSALTELGSPTITKKEIGTPPSSSLCANEQQFATISLNSHKSPGSNSTSTMMKMAADGHTESLPQKYDRLLKKKLEQDNVIRDLKAQNKKLSEQYKDLKLLLDMQKSVSKETREKAQLMASERKYKMEFDELKKQFQKLQEEHCKKDGRSKKGEVRDEDVQREICRLKDEKEQLQKKLSLQKQEDEALLNEMEVTGSAFEDMQEQNLRLIQQLKEKDDANFKLMSERIKSQQIQKLLKEEKESLTEQIIALHAQVEAQNQVVRKLEEKERLLQNNLSTIEKELGLRQQAMEMHKRKAIEAAQSAADLKLHLDKYLAQLKEAQSSVAEKSSIHQQEAFKTKRLYEELNSWKRKYERAKKFELASTADEVLLEEIREYKEQLTCPSCKVNRKDAVLTKCFHVFCFDCLKTRYDTRQRKCPKCNAAMGAHDFHRLYLA